MEDHYGYDYDEQLQQAIEQWESGRPIPLTLATDLMQKGYDVVSLEERYVRYE